MPPNVLALTRYSRIGASSRVRFLQYIPHLERMGARIMVRSLFPTDYLTRLYAGKARSPTIVTMAMAQRLWHAARGHSADIVWLQREMLPFAPFVLEKLLLRGQKLVIDFDDAHHLYYRDLTSWLARTAYGSKIEKLMQRANAVVVGNHTLAEHAHGVGATNVHVVPSAVSVQRFKKKVINAPGTFQVGWIGTPVTARQSLHLVREPLLRFLSDFRATCVLVGVGQNQFPEIQAERIAWSEAAEEDVLPRISVGLCPLEDTPWNRSKSGYKIIQYMAAGKPALGSPVGIAEQMITHGSTGFHCVTSSDWYSYLAQLHNNADLREVMGEKARAEAEAKYDTASAAITLYQIFEDCLRG
jgi:glycosyltransferase involved in cell wall biosynthesis